MPRNPKFNIVDGYECDGTSTVPIEPDVLVELKKIRTRQELWEYLWTWADREYRKPYGLTVEFIDMDGKQYSLSAQIEVRMYDGTRSGRQVRSPDELIGEDPE